MLLALITSALAASNEVDLEVGWLGSGDTSFDRVSEANFFPTYGLRVGVKVHTNVAVLAGWQHGQAGNTIDTAQGLQGRFQLQHHSPVSYGTASTPGTLTMYARQRWESVGATSMEYVRPPMISSKR